MKIDRFIASKFSFSSSNPIIPSKLTSLMFDRFEVLKPGKTCQFMASNLAAIIKFIALIDQFSRKTNDRVALTDTFL
jgi:hypothetical protein